MQSRIMKTHHLHSEVWLPSPRDQVFRFFADPKNLQQLTPNWLHFEILSPEGKIEMGTLLDYRLKLRGMPLRWQSEISVWQPLHRFLDRQTKGRIACGCTSTRLSMIAAAPSFGITWSMPFRAEV
jgi:ligand-binding SRPBCC domain-containing protein